VRALPIKIAATLSFACTLVQSEAVEGPPAPEVGMELYASPSPPLSDALTSITVVLRNQGRPIVATLQILIRTKGCGVIAPVNVQLPAQSSRRVQVYGQGWIHDCTVDAVLHCKGKAVAQATTAVAGPGPVVVDRRPLSLLAGLNQVCDPSSPPKWALPDTHWAYAGISAIVLGDARLDGLTSVQARAITGYVCHGGTLIVVAGRRGDLLLQTLLRDLLPGVTSRVVKLPSLTALGDRFRAPLAGDGSVACSILAGPGVEGELYQDGVPVVAVRPVLRGRVVWIGFDAFSPRFRDWPGMANFWRHWIHGYGQRPDRALNHFHPHLGLSATGLAPPSITCLIVFFGAYVLCLGPGIAWLSRRVARPAVVWLLLSFVALVFSALTPLLRGPLRDQPSSFMTATLVEQLAGRRLARYGMAGLVRSRGREAHRIAHPSIHGSMVLGTGWERRCVTPADSHGAGVAADSCHVGMWGTQVLDVEGVTNELPAMMDGRAIMLAPGSWRIELCNRGLSVIPAGVVLAGPQCDRKTWPGAATRQLEPGQAQVIEIGPVDAPVRLDVWPWEFGSESNGVGSLPESWIEGCIPLIVGDAWDSRCRSGNPPFASTFTSRLAGLPWPKLEHDRLLRHEGDFRALVVWLPVERRAQARTKLEFGAVRPRSHCELAYSAWVDTVPRIHEFRLPVPKGHVLAKLHVRVRYREPAEGRRPPVYGIYDYQCGRWRGLTPEDKFPGSYETVRVGWRSSRSLQTFEAVLANPGWTVARTANVVTLRESKGPQGGPRRTGSELADHVQIEATFAAKGAPEPMRPNASSRD